MPKSTNILKDNKGQALLFVVVALTIATVVGVSVSTRTLQMSKRVSTTDTHARVYYAAEAGIERFAALPMNELNDISEGSGCGTTGATLTEEGCAFDLGNVDDVITVTHVDVTAISYNADQPSDHYLIAKANDGVYSGVALSGYTGGQVTICWESINNNPIAALFYSVWGGSSLISKGILAPVGWTDSPIELTGETTADDLVRAGYSSCKAVTTPGNSYMLYAMPLGNDAKLGFFPGTSDLPKQGYRITSKARLKDTSSAAVQVTKIIETIRSYNHVPGFFDSIIYAQGDIIAD